jgi:hypothetical protein
MAQAGRQTGNDPITDAANKIVAEDAAGIGDTIGKLRKLDPLNIAFTTRKCQLKAKGADSAKFKRSFRYKRLGGVVWSKWIDLTSAVVQVPSVHPKADGRGFDIVVQGISHTFLACSTSASSQFKNKLLRAKAAASQTSRASLEKRATERIKSRAYLKGALQTGRGFLARGPIEILKMSTVITGARSTTLGKLSGREWTERYFTLSHDGIAGMFMNEEEFETLSAMAEARKREAQSDAGLLGLSSQIVTIVEDVEISSEEEECAASAAFSAALADVGGGGALVTVTDPIKGVGSVIVPAGVEEGDTFEVHVGIREKSFDVVAPAKAGTQIEIHLPTDTEYTQSIKRLESWHVHQNNAKALAQSFDLKRGVRALERTAAPRELVLRGPRFGKHGKLVVRFRTSEDLDTWVNQFLQVPAVRAMVSGKRVDGTVSNRHPDAATGDEDATDVVAAGAVGGLFAGLLAVDLLSDLFDDADDDGECAVM